MAHGFGAGVGQPQGRCWNTACPLLLPPSPFAMSSLRSMMQKPAGALRSQRLARPAASRAMSVKVQAGNLAVDLRGASMEACSHSNAVAVPMGLMQALATVEDQLGPASERPN